MAGVQGSAGQSAGAATYHVGQVVNGYEFTGTEWIPHVEKAAAPAQPHYQVGDVVNGYRFNGVEWVPYPGTSQPPPPPQVG